LFDIGLRIVEGDFGFGFGVVGGGIFDAGEIFDGKVDVYGTRGAVQAGKF